MLRNERNDTNYWGQFATTYDDKLERMMGKGVRQNLFRMLERESGLGDAVEFGCGTGLFYPGDRGECDARHGNGPVSRHARGGKSEA